jgi:hypothetical protein
LPCLSSNEKDLYTPGHIFWIRKVSSVKEKDWCGLMDKMLVFGGMFFASLALSMILTGAFDCTGTTSMTNCATYGCLYVKNSTDAIKMIWDGGGFIDIRGSLTQSWASGGWTPTSNYVFIRNTTEVVAVFSVNGNIAITGTLSENNSIYCTPPAGSFVMKDSSGNCVGYIGPTGGLWLRGAHCYNASSTCCLGS